jgi:hypothetical protein
VGCVKVVGELGGHRWKKFFCERKFRFKKCVPKHKMLFSPDPPHNYFGPSGVRALPLAAGINVGGHYKWHFFLFFSLSSGLIANSPRRDCRRVLKFCMGS